MGRNKNIDLGIIILVIMLFMIQVVFSDDCVDVNDPSACPDGCPGQGDTLKKVCLRNPPNPSCRDYACSGTSFHGCCDQQCYHSCGDGGGEEPEPVNGACGTATNSCTSGTFQDVTDNPTTSLWKCKGSDGGSDASCSKCMPSTETCDGIDNNCNNKIDEDANGVERALCGTVSIGTDCSEGFTAFSYGNFGDYANFLVQITKPGLASKKCDVWQTDMVNNPQTMGGLLFRTNSNSKNQDDQPKTLINCMIQDLGWSSGQSLNFKPIRWQTIAQAFYGADVNKLIVAITYYKDYDNDGYSDGTNITDCTAPEGFKTLNQIISKTGDCNDNDPTAHQGGMDLTCDAVDNNCDGIFTPFYDGMACTSDDDCCEGHACVISNLKGDKFCRPTKPYCGDQYCYDGEDALFETCENISSEVSNFPTQQIGVCKRPFCKEGLTLGNLPLGDYPTGKISYAFLQSCDPTSLNNECSGTLECCTKSYKSLEDGQTKFGGNQAAVETYDQNEAWDDASNQLPDAKWIWSEDEVTNPERDVQIIFTRTIYVDPLKIPASAKITLAADNLVNLKINGETVQLFPIYFMSALTFDITNKIKTGTNNFEFDVTNYGAEGSNSETNPAGLIYKIEFLYGKSVSNLPCTGCSHCNGNGSCVSDCLDKDGDGFGIQPDTLFNTSCCTLGSGLIDCNDDNINVHPSTPLRNSSPYCDCNPNTGEGFTQGTDEGPSNIGVIVSQDRCFDGQDNDCDNLVDCADPNCAPPGYSYPIKSRRCFGDCTNTFKTDTDHDRACCPEANNCVINGVCVQSGQTYGEFPNTHLCMGGISGVGNQWYGGDINSVVCSAVVNDTVYDPFVYSHWGLMGNTGNRTCCGDDLNEYFTLGIDNTTACCNKPNMYVLAGNCVSELIERSTWDKSRKGYCLGPNQCLVNPNITSFIGDMNNVSDITYPFNNNLRCLDDGQFIGDHYCSNGKWMSRTAMIATQLIDFSDSITEASIFCDSYDKVLNYYGYSISGNYAENYLGIQGFQCMLGENPIPCTNNVCVLEYNDDGNKKTVIGTSLNQEVNSPTYSILEAFNGNNRDCDGYLGATVFLPCGTGVSYNHRIKSVIFSKDSINLANVLTGQWMSYLEGIYYPILNFIGYYNFPSYNYGFAKNLTQDFNRIYLGKKGDKKIFIITEEKNSKKYMSATYYKFATDICTQVKNYVSINPKLVPFNCVKEGDYTYVVTGGLSAGYYDLLDDLGPKLRLE